MDDAVSTWDWASGGLDRPLNGNMTLNYASACAHCPSGWDYKPVPPSLALWDPTRGSGMLTEHCNWAIPLVLTWIFKIQAQWGRVAIPAWEARQEELEFKVILVSTASSPPDCVSKDAISQHKSEFPNLKADTLPHKNNLQNLKLKSQPVVPQPYGSLGKGIPQKMTEYFLV